MEKEEYKLCYIDGQKAYFTNNFEHQWGDDWDDRPYECNAGTPYDNWSERVETKPPIYEKQYIHHPIKIKTLYFETNDWDERKPCDMGRFSVEDINKGTVAWIATEKFCIQAGTNIVDFINIIKENGGSIWMKI